MSALLPLGAFVLVVALIPVALVMLKRAGVGGAATGGVLKPIANLGLGTTQRVAVVEVAVGHDRHWLVLGITGEQVNALATYAAPDASSITPPPATPAHAVTVQQLLSRWRAGRDGSEGGAR